MMTLTGPSVLASPICALTIQGPDVAYRLVTRKDDRGYYVTINGLSIRPPDQDRIDTRRKAIVWTLELYQLYVAAYGR